jgi:phosphoglycerate kinase
MRVDFNVPMQPDGVIADDTRIRASLPSIEYVLAKGGALILMSHLGRPKGKPVAAYSLAPCAKRLEELLHRPVLFAADCVGETVEEKAAALRPGQVLLLENLRFHPAEEDPQLNPSFARRLAQLGDCYVNDAFGSAHRPHSSVTAVARLFPGAAAAGFLMERELSFLQPLLLQPKRPFYALVGGAKISSKISVLRALAGHVDALFIGGGMAFTFLKALGHAIGDSLYEENLVEEARALLDHCTIPVHLPTDCVIADAFRNDAHVRIVSTKEGIPPGWRGLDVGPSTIHEWTQALQHAATVLWNGPLGVYEFPRFAAGTHAVAQALAAASATTIIGGGDSAAAVHTLGLASAFSHICTGGGASLEFLEHGTLPGIEALSTQ